jgi:hypothetical protein
VYALKPALMSAFNETLFILIIFSREFVRIWSGVGMNQKLNWAAKIYGLRGEGQQASKRERLHRKRSLKERRD